MQDTLHISATTSFGVGTNVAMNRPLLHTDEALEATVANFMAASVSVVPSNRLSAVSRIALKLMVVEIPDESKEQA